MDISFDRDWYDYKIGFGNKDKRGDFWLGLENIFRITSQTYSTYTIWIVLTDSRKIPHVFSYGSFSLDSEAGDYRLTLSNVHGTSGRYLYDKKVFVTRDHKPTAVNPSSSNYNNNNVNCASLSNSRLGGGGWWFTSPGLRCCAPDYSCGYSNLNAKVPYWYSLKNITSVVMKIRPT